MAISVNNSQEEKVKYVPGRVDLGAILGCHEECDHGRLPGLSVRDNSTAEFTFVFLVLESLNLQTTHRTEGLKSSLCLCPNCE